MDEWIEEAIEVGDEQIADVKAVHVGIGGQDDFAIAEVFNAVLDVEGAHEVVHLVVLVHDVTLEVPDVEGLALEDEDGLRLDVTAAHDAAGGALAFGEEDHRFATFVALLVEMNLAILELGNAQGDGLGPFAGQLLDLLEFLAKLPAVLHLRQDVPGDLLVAIEEMKEFLADFVDEIGTDFRVAKLVLGLRLEDGILQSNGDRADHRFAHVIAVVPALGVFVHRLEQALAEGAEVRAAVGRVLAVDERIESLPVTAVGVGETELQHLAGVVERRINRLGVVLRQLLEHQVVQAVTALERLAIEDQFEPAVEVGVVTQALLDKVGAELGGVENRRIRLEGDEGAVRLAGGLALVLLLEAALFEGSLDEFAATMAADGELLRERVDGLRPDAVEADAELEDVIVVFGPGVDLGDAIDHFAQGDAASEVAHAHARAFDVQVDFLAEAHDEFVDGVIDHFFEEDVTAVVVMGAVADAPDVHAGAQPDVFKAAEGLDLAFVVIVLLRVRHTS